MAATAMACSPLLLLLLLCARSALSAAASDHRKPRVAVIGAGVSGAFFAASLQNMSNFSFELDIYESSDRIGGRTLDTSALGESPRSTVELGASMFIAQNRLIADAAASLGLDTQSRAEATSGRGRLLLLSPDGRPAFIEAGGGARSAYRMLHRFGLRGMRRLHSLGRDFIGNFSKLYEAIDLRTHFVSAHEMLAHVGMELWPMTSCTAVMTHLLGSPTHPAATELVSALMNNNYGQPWEHAGALCCFTAVAPLAAGGSAAGFYIRGGNAQLAEGLLKRSRATIYLSTTVVSLADDVANAADAADAADADAHIAAAEAAAEAVADAADATGGGYLLTAIGNAGATVRRYDHVVLAAPCLAGSRKGLLGRCRALPFRAVHVTLVHALLDPRPLGAAASLSPAELNTRFGDVLLAEGDHGLPFNSIGRGGVLTTPLFWLPPPPPPFPPCVACHFPRVSIAILPHVSHVTCSPLVTRPRPPIA